MSSPVTTPDIKDGLKKGARASYRFLWGSALPVSLLSALSIIFSAGSCSLAAQNPPPATTDSQSQTAPRPQQIPRVTTTVLVHGEVKDDYLSEALTAGSLDNVPIEEAPLSATAVTSALMSDQVARVLSDVVKNDASIGEDYAPVGYYGDFQIRGFPIDLATGLQVNGLTISGEQDVPLENKDRVEIVKGIAGVETGVASPAGVIDFATKRPVAVKAVDFATDHRGTAYGAVDLGHLFGADKRAGARLNLGAERIATYVNDANGWRAVGAGSADFRLSAKALLKTDFEYQHKVQRSVVGYQLLGGSTLPDLHRISPATMLGEQPWSKPNTFDVYNADSRIDYDLPHAWRAYIAASFSHSLIDDNVVYAYGCYYEDICNGTTPPWFFAPDGTYDIYDYRNPGELRINAQAEAIITGHLRTGAIDNEITVGGEIFRRSVQMPNAAVYTYVGSENIYTPNAMFPIESPVESAGPRVLFEDNHQAALVVQDRVSLPGHLQLLAAGRYDSLRDHNYSADVNTDKLIWLPQYAATWNPREHLMIYANYSVLLSLGQQAPFWTINGSQFLNPYTTRQTEIGAKYEPGQRTLLTASLFRMRAPFFYPRDLAGPDTFCPEANAGDLCFESVGHETHSGAELNAQGKVASWLQLNASAALIRAISDQTGTPDFDNKQVINVPHLRAVAFGDVLVPRAHGLHLLPGWAYTGRKEATRDDQVSVPAYNLFNLGARYTPGGENGRLTVRMYADNITNRRYWKDTGASYGDSFLHLGAPTTVRLSAHYTF